MAEEAPRCRLVAVRAVGGQEYNVAVLIKARAESKGDTNISSIVVLPNFKGFVFFEGAPPYEVSLIM
jgi:transcriptional antiterminator NusG